MQRTGIFRYAENVALGLAASKECDLTFCAPESLSHFYGCVDYLKANPQFSHVPLLYSDSKLIQLFKNPDTRLSYLNDELGSVVPSSSTQNPRSINRLRELNLAKRIVRKLLHGISGMANARFSTLAANDLASTDIYHSPLYPLPEPVRQAKNLNRFLMVHDLLPLSHPQFFLQDHIDRAKHILSGLTLDDWVTCTTQWVKNDLCNHLKIDPRRVFLTPSAAAPDIFYPCTDTQEILRTRNKYHIPEGQYILSLCTLEPRKNLDHAIASFADLIRQENLPDLSLVLVGAKGWLSDKIFESLSQNDTLRDRILVTGFVADEDLAALYSGALAFVYPSLAEGFGLPPVEAMQCGVPVITSNATSLPEVVGDAGILLDPADRAGLCQSMLDLYNDPALRQSLSLRSLERAKHFSWERCVRETIVAYKTALTT